jgi:hypothetical protein
VKKVLVIVLGCLVASSAIEVNAKSLADAANYGQGEKGDTQGDDTDSGTNSKVDTEKVITTDELGKKYGGGGASSAESAGVTDSSGNPVGYLNANKEAIVKNWIKTRKFAQFGLEKETVNCGTPREQKAGGTQKITKHPDGTAYWDTRYGGTYTDPNPSLFKASVSCNFWTRPRGASGSPSYPVYGDITIYYFSPTDIRWEGKVN